MIFMSNKDSRISEYLTRQNIYIIITLSREETITINHDPDN